MEAYTGFAEVYDKFMDNIDYPMWCHYLCELLKDNGVETGTLVELGCGTGNVTMGLAKEFERSPGHLPGVRHFPGNAGNCI